MLLLLLKDDNDAFSSFLRMIGNLVGLLLTLFESPAYEDALQTWVKKVPRKSSAEVTRVYNLCQFKVMPFKVLVTAHNLFKFGLGPTPAVVPTIIFALVAEDVLRASNIQNGGGNEGASSFRKRLQWSSSNHRGGVPMGDTSQPATHYNNVATNTQKRERKR
ncbi:unnamed protein product [Ilex paraguariensis]|uniref:Uncharacterized protein n=1 Tax=Ilex paraguariensis TaxID=185542 RepID=A0ABC8QPN5_9AQUA